MKTTGPMDCSDPAVRMLIGLAPELENLLREAVRDNQENGRHDALDALIREKLAAIDAERWKTD